MTNLLPRTMPHPTDPAQGDVVNASAVVELARRIDNPQSRAFLKAFHAAEADVARERPDLSEERIRSDAVVRALEALGHRVVEDRGGRP